MNASVEKAWRLLLSSASAVRRLLTACATYCFFSSPLARRALSRRICARLFRASTVWSGSTWMAWLKSDSASPRSPRFVLTTALGQHGALVEAGLQEARVAVGDRLEGIGDAAALPTGQAARFLGRGVALHRLLEVGALVLADGALLLLGDELRGACLADGVVLGRLTAHGAGLFVGVARVPGLRRRR